VSVCNQVRGSRVVVIYLRAIRKSPSNGAKITTVFKKIAKFSASGIALTRTSRSASNQWLEINCQDKYKKRQTANPKFLHLEPRRLFKMSTMTYLALQNAS